MNTQYYLTNPERILRARELDRIGGQRKFENGIESRANNLSELVTRLAQSPFPSLRTYADSIDEELEALLVKEARLRWLVRVAKYSEGTNRHALWLEAEKVLVDLEKTADAMLYAECV
jgi:hypothetical protein